MSNWSITFRGGFAWVFHRSDHATVGLLNTPPGGAGFEHRMLLSVPVAAIDAHTSLAWTKKDGAAEFVLTGRVEILSDNQPLPPTPLGRARSLAALPTPQTNDFFWVYALGRVRAPAVLPQSPPALRRNWRDILHTDVVLRAGTLTVTGENGREFEMKNGFGVPQSRRFLASTIVYQSAVPAHILTFRTSKGDVRLKAGSAPLALTITADCTCTEQELKAGQALPGFQDMFQLYGALGAEWEIIPCIPSERVTPLLAAVPIVPLDITPGPDCPPHEHDEP
jgi:hypothetical protein